jgi:hypothetical protein
VNQLAFLQPRIGDRWTGGETRYIQWTFEQATVDASISILLENPRWLATPLVVASQTPAIPGAANIVGFKWVVPTNLRSSTQYTLRIGKSFCFCYAHCESLSNYHLSVAQYTGSDNKPPVSSVGPKFSIQQTN